MTIKEIARLSNVSISTVSKILNGKDQSISSETREKVLKVAREYHYAPYENVAGLSRFSVGVVLQDSDKGNLLLAGINRAARKKGYSVVCCTYGSEEDGEKKAIAAMCAQNVPAVIWQRASLQSIEYISYFEEKEIDVFSCDLLQEKEMERQFTLDYGRYGYEAAQYLAEKQHRRIGCCIRERDTRSERFVKGFFRCLYDNGLERRSDFILKWSDVKAFSDITLFGITGLVCMDEEIAADIYHKATNSGYKIPHDFSLLTITEYIQKGVLYPKFTGIYLPIEELGEHACSQVIAFLEKGKKEALPTNIEILEGNTAGKVPEHNANKIVVLGSINMDSVISVRKFPEAGQTCVAEELHRYAGGKGLNQAVGAKKLGADVVLIGKIGQDYEGKVLRDAMASYGLDMESVTECESGGTGRAHITVQSDGESNIIVYAGANRFLTEKDVDNSRHLFAGAKYCLLQLETPMHIVEYTARIAKSQGVRTILKPAVVDVISDTLLEQIDIFVPNRKELFYLCPQGETIEEKAQYFLDKGVKEVIVTLDEHGCFWKNREVKLYFQAANFAAVDTTGAADAFIAALAVYLAEGQTMTMAIQYATYAAGFSIARESVPSSMVDRATMDAHVDTIRETIGYGAKMF